MKKLFFLFCISFIYSSAMGQFPYKKYEQLQKQREKANRYMQQSKENYQKSRYYSYEVYKPGNTAAQRSKNLL